MIRVAFALTVLLVGSDPVRTGRTNTGIAYDVQGAGPAVVLIAGANLDRRMWTAEAEWLKSQFTVIRYDLRAHGQSDVPRMPFSHVRDLFEVLDALHIERAALVGLSAGSTIALDATLHAPDRITRIVLAAPAISGYVSKERPAFFTPLVAALEARDYVNAAEVMLASPLFQVPDSARALVRSMVTENDRLWTVPRELMKGPERPAAERLEEIRTPALVLVGEHDLAAQREQAEVLGRRISGAHLVVVAGGGHMLNLTSAVAFTDAVSGFLTATGNGGNGGYGGN
jgi:pimeloyl-ACP methyl ester carboxylesterase